MRVKVFSKSLFKKVRPTLEIYLNTFKNADTDNVVKLKVIFVILFHKTVVKNSWDNNLLNVNNKKNNALSSSASIMIFQERILALKGGM